MASHLALISYCIILFKIITCKSTFSHWYWFYTAHTRSRNLDIVWANTHRDIDRFTDYRPNSILAYRYVRCRLFTVFTCRMYFRCINTVESVGKWKLATRIEYKKAVLRRERLQSDLKFRFYHFDRSIRRDFLSSACQCVCSTENRFVL